MTSLVSSRSVLAVMAMPIVVAWSPALSAAPVTPPAGWSSAEHAGVQTLKRSFSEGEMTVRVSPWEDLGGETPEAWLGVRKTERSGGKIKVISTEHEVKARKSIGALYVLRQLRPLRGQRRVSMVHACARNGQVRLIDAFGPEPLFDNTNPTSVADAILLAELGCGPADGSGDREPTLVEEQPKESYPLPERPAFALAEPLPGLEAIWYLGGYVPTINGLEYRNKAAMTFADAMATSDFGVVFTESRAASEGKDPDRWGRWRVRDQHLEIKWNGNQDYHDYTVTVKTDPGERDDRLEGCFSKSTTSSLPMMDKGAYNTATAIDEWCFFEDGRFSHEITASIRASTGEPPLAETKATGFSYGDSAKNGWYRIDGYILQLAYDDGRHRTTSIGLMESDDPEKRSLLIGGSYHD